MIDVSILKKEVEHRAAQIDALVDLIGEYKAANSIDEEKSKIGPLLSDVGKIFKSLERSSNRIHLLPLFVSCSYLHLSILREQVIKGEIWWGTVNDEHTTLLHAKFSEYKRLFNTIFEEWQIYRRNSIRIVSDCGFWRHVEVLDTNTNERVYYWIALCDHYWELTATYIKRRMFAEAKAKIAGIMAPSFYLNSLLRMPGDTRARSPEVPLALQEFTIGPYSARGVGFRKTTYHGPFFKKTPTTTRTRSNSLQTKVVGE